MDFGYTDRAVAGRTPHPRLREVGGRLTGRPGGAGGEAYSAASSMRPASNCSRARRA